MNVKSTSIHKIYSIAFMTIVIIALLALSACQALASEPTLSESLVKHSWRWHTGNFAHEFNADGTYASYNLRTPVSENPALTGEYTIDGNRVSLNVGKMEACDPDAVWVWEVNNIDDNSLQFTVVEDDCPGAGGDSTARKWTWSACELEIPDDGFVVCDPING